MIAGPREISDALKVLDSIDFHDRARCYWILRCLFVSQPDDVNFFDFIFESFWSFQKIVDEPEANKGSDLFKGAKNFRKRGSPSFLVDNEQHSENILFKPEYHGANKRNIDGYKNIEYFVFEKTSEMTQLAADILKVLKGKKSRRKVPKNRGRILDFRKLVRSNLKVGSEPLHLSYFDRKIRPPKLSILLDVSGSMEPYARAFIRFVHAAIVSRTGVEAFTLGTRLTRLTRELSTRDPSAALLRTSAVVSDWSGGTRLGEGLKEFNDCWGVRGMARGADVVILSDGWDRGDPLVMSEQMMRLSRVANEVVWVNPLKATTGYEPLAQGMAAALPHVDRFISGHSLKSLEDLADFLVN